ncbi:MAG: YqaE/Pmp3 family membrane protein [Akkermansiaceae bacterium]
MNNRIVAIVLSVLVPPIAVFINKGMGKDLLINIILCLLGYIPGIIHALLINTK